ncbi:MAG TPA: transglutaminase-like domain-containing protein [Abditibacterium sp.]|jgi:hypothetical protein
MQQLPALLKLCDDPSPAVANKVAHRLRELGPDVWDEIQARNILLSESQRAILDAIFASDEDEILREAWLWLGSHGHDHLYLESALMALCDWQSGSGTGARGRYLLDDLAIAFGDYEPPKNSVRNRSEAGSLAHFLFEERGLSGANSDDYYNPLHSNIVHTLEAGQGLPITLACIFILVGRRVGLEIEGCAFPGHFLTRDGKTAQVFDPFNGGRALSSHEVATLRKAAPAEMSGTATAREIVERVLRNLSVAYHQQGDATKSGFMLSLIRLMDEN